MRQFCHFCLTGLFVCLVPSTVFADHHLPRVLLVGDSTVKKGSGRGDGGLWGWGQVLAEHFDTSRVEVENRARGGRSSRTYITEGLWEKALERLRPGDFVLIQFGHNDGGKKFEGDRPRASIKGNGDESEVGVVAMTGKAETVHSFGWYLRKYAADAKDKGATPILLSLIPRDRWKEGKVIRAGNDYGKWTAEAAKQAGVPFIDLNEITSLRFESLGEEKVGRELFTEKDWTHTTRAGAKVVANCVVEGIRGLPDCPLTKYLVGKNTPAPAVKHSSWRFDFGAEDLADGYVSVQPDAMYSSTTGFGFEPSHKLESVKQGGTRPPFQDACLAQSPFYFSAAVPPGNYRVKVSTCGDGPLTIKAELRRLVIQNWKRDPSAEASCQFTVNVRDASLPKGRSVRLKPREKSTEAWAWDDKLTLEFNGKLPCLTAIEITPETDALTVYLAGDSTVCDQPREPWNSWGQMLPRFFRPGVAIANHAESGESIRSSLSAGRFEKIFSLIQPDDYLLIQFGHNDMKNTAPDALATYRKNLVQVVQQTRKLLARPVLVTSMQRKSGPSLGDYPRVVREVASEHDVPLIDLNTMSGQLYEALGENLDKAFQDGTHHTNYGSYLFAKCVVQAIRDNQLDLANLVVEDFTEFSPRSPDSIDDVVIHLSPHSDPTKPAGS